MERQSSHCCCCYCMTRSGCLFYAGGASVSEHAQSADSRRESVAASRAAVADPQVAGAAGARGAAVGTAAGTARRAPVRRGPRPHPSRTPRAGRSGHLGSRCRCSRRRPTAVRQRLGSQRPIRLMRCLQLTIRLRFDGRSMPIRGR